MSLLGYATGCLSFVWFSLCFYIFVGLYICVCVSFNLSFGMLRTVCFAIIGLRLWVRVGVIECVVCTV